MAEKKENNQCVTESSVAELNKIRPFSYTGPLMPRPTHSAETPATGISVAENQLKILVPDFSEYFQRLVDSIFQTTKEEPKKETAPSVPEITEKTATAEFSGKDAIKEFRIKYDPYNKLFYDQCILEGCDPETCYKKYFPEMS